MSSVEDRIERLRRRRAASQEKEREESEQARERRQRSRRWKRQQSFRPTGGEDASPGRGSPEGITEMESLPLNAASLGADLRDNSEDDEGVSTEEEDDFDDEGGFAFTEEESRLRDLVSSGPVVSGHLSTGLSHFQLLPVPSTVLKEAGLPVTKPNDFVIHGPQRAQEQLRRLEEGLFVPKLPKTALQANVKRVERRLLRETGKGQNKDLAKDDESAKENQADAFNKVFTHSGAMIALEDPAKSILQGPVDAEHLFVDRSIAESFSTFIAPAKGVNTANMHVPQTQGHALLDIDVFTCSFDDHPLFIEEDKASKKLQGLVEQYRRVLRTKSVEHWFQQTVAVVEKGKAMLHEDNATSEEDQKRALGALKREAFNNFSSLLNAELEIKELSRDIYNTWLDLKEIRKSQGFASTNSKLSVMKAELPYDNDQLNSCVEVLAKLNEINEENSARAAQILSLYRETRGAKGSVQNKRRRVQRRKKSRTEDVLEGAGMYVLRLTEDAPYTKDDEVNSFETRRRNSVRQSWVYCKLYINGHLVGQSKKAKLSWPRFTANLNKTFQVAVFQRPESIRIEICGSSSTTSSYLVSSISTVHLPVPAANVQATTVLADSIGPSNTLHQFSSVKPIPRRSWQWERPSGGQRKRMREVYQELEDGAGAKGEAAGVLEDRYTSGTLHTCLAWRTGTASSSEVMSLPPYYESTTYGRLIGGLEADLAGGKAGGGNNLVSSEAVEFDDEIPDFAREVDFQVLIEVLRYLDPRDPRNASILRLLDTLELSHTRGDVFREDALLREALFPSANIFRFKVSNRIRLLKLRTTKPHLFHQPIPTSDLRIRQQENLHGLLLAQAEDPTQEESLQVIGNSKLAKFQREQRLKVNDFVNKIRQQQKVGIGKGRVVRDIPVSSLVKEEILPAFKLDLEFLIRFFAPRRKLRPQAKVRKAASSSVKAANIFVQVVRAQNVPVRRIDGNTNYPASPGRSPMKRSEERDQEAAKDQGDDDDFGGGVERVMSFVQARFQGTTRRTSAQEGPSPTWSESIFLPFVPPRNDFSPNNLKAMRDELYLNLFDEVIVEGETNDYRTEDLTFQRREKRYLGRVAIPFSTIYLNGRIEGLFRLETPAVNLGYAYRNRGAVVEGDGGEFGRETSETHDSLRNEAANSTYVYLMATLDPVLVTPDQENTLGMPKPSEKSKLLRRARRWESSIKSKCARLRQGNVKVVVEDIDGNSVFITRYISAQVPPIDAQGRELDTVEKLVRFVSLIPFLDDWQAFLDGEHDVWSTSQQFLELCAGDWEEHAVLLCNYMLWFCKKKKSYEVYLVLGSAIPEGETVYVLLADTNTSERVLWNASTGKGYLVTDKNCPVYDVALLVNENNVWANIQEHGSPQKIRWNLENRKDWCAFWTEGQEKSEAVTLQSERLNYVHTSKKLVLFLEGEITSQLQRSIRRWRSKRGTTRFNKIIGRKLKPLLEQLERSKQGVYDSTLDGQHLDALRETVATSEIVGFPLNMTFTEMDAVIRAVKNTDIHNMIAENVQYALAVLVVPYSCNVCSVWVYVAAILSNR